ncbi:uncharacterized protein LOC127256798 [Andrographis paniculata]|uniref:uncharacterized protein LOC127256798 n=1 Tax=Andrographis paniculata TaxID=175694 RepID=UPI0021E86A2D|nr:uncharacterized protein LOC127256798 [Andrographis paniculata]
MVTWEMLARAGMGKLIESDLTSSFCFLSGMASGCLCGLVGGIPALLLYKSYAAEIATFTFLTGYFMNRVAMAWIQSSISAYYVAYAENPQGQQFDTLIPNYIRDLERLSQA